MYLYGNYDYWQTTLDILQDAVIRFHIKCNQNLGATLEKYIYCVIFFPLFSVQTLRSKDGKPGSVLKIPVSILKTAQTGSY